MEMHLGPTLTITLSPSTGSICPPPTASPAFLSVSGASTYVWMPGSLVSSSPIVQPAVSTNYTVTGTGANGCTNSATQFLFVHPPPTLIVTPPPPVCSGNSACFTTSGDLVIFSWNGPCGDVSGSPNPCLMSNTSCGTTYTVGGTNANGCLAITSINISLNAAPIISVNSGTICSGNSFTIIPSGASTYTYSSGTAIVSPTTASSYSVTGTGVNGCITAMPAIVNVTVNSLPIISATTNNSIICTTQSATLTSGGANTYTWSNASNGNSIIISPTVNTTYTVTGTDASGCENYATITQSVSVCTGVEKSNNLEVMDIKLYPNPGTGIFNLEFTSKPENTNVEIYNSIGQLILFHKINSENTSIDLKKYANGIYYLKVNGCERQFKIIKE
ncbi:MAG: T9SS type A sorting domain-containing protein [Bacteroidetes bacterium]|nr:T9SS type A sorting domain-containing protein [Bacteroidota bacterium]